MKPLQSLDEVDPELQRTYERLGIPLREQKMLAGVAVDAIDIWLAILAGHAARCTLSVIRFNQGKWRGIAVDIGGGR